MHFYTNGPLVTKNSPMCTHHLVQPISALEWWAFQGSILHTHLSLQCQQAPGCLKSESAWTWDDSFGKEYSEGFMT